MTSRGVLDVLVGSMEVARASIVGVLYSDSIVWVFMQTTYVIPFSHMTFPQYLTVARWLTASYCLLPLISSSCAFVQGARYEYSKTPQKSQEYHVKGKTKHPTNRNKSWRKWTITLKPRKTLTNVQGTVQGLATKAPKNKQKMEPAPRCPHK